MTKVVKSSGAAFAVRRHAAALRVSAAALLLLSLGILTSLLTSCQAGGLLTQLTTSSDFGSEARGSSAGGATAAGPPAAGTEAWLSAPGWIQTGGPAGGRVLTVAVDRQKPDVVYAGMVDGGVYLSPDGGDSWEPVVRKADSYADVAASEGAAFFTSHNVPFRVSRDHGETWEEIHLGTDTAVGRLRWSSQGNVLFAATMDHRIFASTDDGRTFRDVTGNLPKGPISCMAASGPEEYWVGKSTDAEKRLFHSADGGRTWTPSSLPQPPASFVSHVLAAEDDPRVLFVGLKNAYNEGRPPDHDYFWKSADGGKTWDSILHPFDPNPGGLPLAQGTDGALYANVANRLWVSRDAGRSWEKRTFHGLPDLMKFGDFGCMAVDPLDPGVLYVPTMNGVIKSADGGASWSLDNHGMTLTSISLIAVHPQDAQTIYAASAGGEGTFRSTDGGDTWDWLNGNGLPHPWADELVADPVDRGTVYEVVDIADVYRTTDGGASWDRIWPGFRFSSVDALAVSASNPNVMYAVKNGFGLFKTENAGRRWRFLHQSGVDYTYGITVHPRNPDIVFSGCNPKPFEDAAVLRRSLDGGSSWESVLEVPGSGGITSVAIDPGDPDTVYAGSVGLEGGCVYRSTDGGTRWKPLNSGFTMCTVWGQPQLVVDPTDPRTAYTGTWLAGTWKTTDAGKSWRRLEQAPVSATSLSLDPQQPGVLYLTDRTAPKVWKSQDAGESWAVVGDFRRGGAFAANRVLARGGAVYAATFGPGLHGGKLYKSTDRGGSWSDITGTLPRSVLDIAVDPSDPDRVYATTHIHGAYRSEDGGGSWRVLEEFPDIGGYDIEVDLEDPDTLYACGMGGCTVPDWCMGPDGYAFSDPSGVYKSTDRGGSWRRVLETANECRAVRLLAEEPGTVFAAAMDDGLLVSRDGGESWTAFNKGLATTVLTSCAVAGSTVYAGSQGCGVASGTWRNDKVQWDARRSGGPRPAVYSLEIRVDPVRSDRIFVSANPGGVYRSDNGGETFYDKNFLTPSVVVDDPFRQGYYTFDVSPRDPEEVWVGTWGRGIYKSYDAMDFGISAHGRDRALYGKYIYDVLIDPTEPDTVYAACEEGIFRTTDAGASWHAYGDGLLTPQIRALAFGAEGRLWAGSKGYGLFSIDPKRESSWCQMPAFGQFGTLWPMWDGRPLYQYTSLLVHPEDNDIMYLGTFPAGIYKTVDGGEQWLEHNVGWTNDGVFCLVFHPENPEIVYAGTYNGLNRSLDGGAHWEMWDNGWPAEQWVFTIAFDPWHPDVMYACSKNGENMGRGRDGFHGTVMKSVDGGAHWLAATEGLNLNQEIYDLTVDPVQPDVLYLATSFEGIFISRNAGGSWEPWNEGLGVCMAGTNGNNVTNVLDLSADGRWLYFGTAGAGVWKRKLPRK